MSGTYEPDADKRIAELEGRLQICQGLLDAEQKARAEAQNQIERLKEQIDGPKVLSTWQEIHVELAKGRERIAALERGYSNCLEEQSLLSECHAQLQAERTELLEQLRLHKADALRHCKAREEVLEHWGQERTELLERIAELERGLREALEWNWLDDDAPEETFNQLYKLTEDGSAK